eukprot:gene9359-3241_t
MVGPVDPGGDAGVWMVHGMQKTCGCSGREFYALGRYDAAAHSFALLDRRSDMANNLWDGGEGYATMTVVDPTRRPHRRLWIAAVIEGDRDPSNCSAAGFWQRWAMEREAGRGWFGTLSLPRVALVANYSMHYADGSTDLASLRDPASRATSLSAIRGSSIDLSVAWEVDLEQEGWDVGVKVLWDDSAGAARGGEEYGGKSCGAGRPAGIPLGL